MVLAKNGWVLLPDDDLQLELETLLRYTEIDDQIRLLFTELQRLQRAKSERIANQDFENALKTWDEQNTLRNELDALVGNRYHGSPPA